MARCAPCLELLTRQINERYPNRDRQSDGCCASAAHHGQNPTSDHEPNLAGWCRAKDIDEDLLGLGFPYAGNAHALELCEALYVSRDSRIKYLIYERQILYPNDGARPRGRYAYNGINAHEHHLHVSTFDPAVEDLRLWEIELAHDPEVDEMVYRLFRNGKDDTQPLVGLIEGKLVAMHSPAEVAQYVAIGAVQPGNHVDLEKPAFAALEHAYGGVHSA